MNESGEREQHEDGKTDRDMRLEYPVSVGDLFRCARLEINYTLCPGHELCHLMPVKVLERNED